MQTAASTKTTAVAVQVVVTLHVIQKVWQEQDQLSDQYTISGNPKPKCRILLLRTPKRGELHAPIRKQHSGLL